MKSNELKLTRVTASARVTVREVVEECQTDEVCHESNDRNREDVLRAHIRRRVDALDRFIQHREGDDDEEEPIDEAREELERAASARGERARSARSGSSAEQKKAAVSARPRVVGRLDATTNDSAKERSSPRRDRTRTRRLCPQASGRHTQRRDRYIERRSRRACVQRLTLDRGNWRERQRRAQRA